MRKSRMVMVALVLAAGSAHAADPTANVGQRGYGTAGCGLGSLLFDGQKGAVQILAATTNDFLGTQTFGITFGTSNCGESAIGTAGTKTFIEGNREALAKDAARGSGETITTLTALAGCKDAKAVGAVLQKRFAELFPGEAVPAEQVSAAVIGTLRSDVSLACAAIAGT
jgi:Protein of unknown function (DUF3015)